MNCFKRPGYRKETCPLPSYRNASQPAGVLEQSVYTYLACASSLRGVKSERSCGCNQFPVGLAVKPTWAAHAGQIYYYAARERRRRTRARRGRGEGKPRKERERERVATDPSGMRDAACDTGNSFTWRGVRAPRSTPANVKLNARGRTRGWARALAMRAYRFLDDPRFPRLRREARQMISREGGVSDS